MEAAAALSPEKAQEMPNEKQETKSIAGISEAVAEMKVNASEPVAEDLAKATGGTKLKVPEAAETEIMEATRDAKSESMARAAEKVARAQIAIVLKSAKAEVVVRSMLAMGFGAFQRYITRINPCPEELTL